MAFPFASIIVPVYNGKSTIAECIESLLSQDYPKDMYEIIIVDNNSTDNTAKIIKKYPVKYILENSIQSSYAAKNTGARHAKGEALVFFDADEVATATWLRSLLMEWDKEEYGAFGAKEVQVIPERPLFEKYLQGDQKESYSYKGALVKLSTASAAYRKHCFELLGGFDQNFATAGDHELGYRLQKELGFKN